MDVETFVEEVVGCGNFQWILLVVLNVIEVVLVWTAIFMAYGNYDPGWTCTLLHDSANASSNLNNGDLNTTFNLSRQVAGTCDVIDSCAHVTFSSEASTIVTEWSLHCDKNWALSIILTLQMIGMTAGAAISGPIADRYGRKPSFLLWTAILVVINLAVYFVENWQTFAACRFFLGLAMSGASVVRPMHLMEFTKSRWRVLIATFPFHAAFGGLFGLLVYLLRDWRTVHLATSLVAAVGFVLLLWMPESLRWLAVHGKVTEAHSVAERVCKYNKKPIPDKSSLNFVSSEGTKSERKGNFLALFNRALISRTLLTTWTLFASAGLYYAIFFGVKNLYGNFYINLVAISIVSIPFFPIAPALSNWIGRRLGSLSFFLYCGVLAGAIILVFFSTSGSIQGITITTLAMACVVGLDHVWSLLVAYVAELYPTSLRASSIAWAKAATRIGGIVAPYAIPADYSLLYVPYIIATVLCALCCLAVLGLPETKGTRMLDTLKQLECSAELANSEKLRGGLANGELEDGMLTKTKGEQGKEVC